VGDLTQIPALEFLALQLFSEVGRDMSLWASAACFVSWLALCPDNDISGGRVLWRGNRGSITVPANYFVWRLTRSTQPHTHGGLIAKDEGQARTAGRTHRHSSQSCGDLLRHDQKPN